MGKSFVGGRYCGLPVRLLDDPDLIEEFKTGTPQNRQLCEAEIERRRRCLVEVAQLLLARFNGLATGPDAPLEVLQDLVEHCHLY